MQKKCVNSNVAADSEFVNSVICSVRNRIALNETMDDSKAREIIAEEVFRRAEAEEMGSDELTEISRRVFYKTRSSLGILKPLVDDTSVTEIMVNGPDRIFIEKYGRMQLTELAFDSIEELEEIMHGIAAEVHREINELSPIVDARLADGSRVNGVYKNIAVSGPTLTIRKFSDSYMRMSDLTANGTVDEVGALLLEALVAAGYNIFVSGGTSSGKTTLLNALSEFIPKEERVIVVEDSTELQLNYIDNLVQLECRQGNTQGKGRITMGQLIKSSLRMRPDRIIVGEVRGEEVLDMLQAMNTGHSGSLSTGHGNSISGMLRRLEAMYIMAMPLDIEAVRSQIAEGIDIMVHIEKFAGGRHITEISELEEYSDGSFKINELMSIGLDGRLITSGKKLKAQGKLRLRGGKYIDGLQKLGII